MIREHVDLEPLTSFRTPARARWLVRVGPEGLSPEELHLVQNNPVLPLGMGTNVLFTSNIDHVVVQVSRSDVSVLNTTENYVDVMAGAGLSWDDFVAWTLDNNYYGLENLSLIPGTVGAAPVQNIGAYGKEAADFIHEVRGVDLSTGEVRTYTKDACEFSYRSSIFKRDKTHRFLITKVVFRLDTAPRVMATYATLAAKLKEQDITDPTPQNVRDAVIAVRSKRLPDWKSIPNAGSFFTNPIISRVTYETIKQAHPDMPCYPETDDRVKIPAAWLLDQLGYKGHWHGNVGCYEQQPLVIVSNGQATGVEIVDFARGIIKKVQDTFGITLTPEVNIIRRHDQDTAFSA